MRIGRIFYFDKREEEIYKEMLENLQCMIKGAKFLEKSVMELRGKQHDKDVSKAIEFEKTCDIKTTHITEEILKITHSRSRQDLLLLNQGIEKISKSIEATSYRIQMSRGIRLPDYLNAGLQKMAKEMVKTIEAFENALKNMPYFSEEVIKHLEKVHEHEEKMDDLRRKSCNEFVHSKGKLPIQKYYIWQEIVTKMESIADNCDETAEIISRIIASKDNY